MEADEVKLGHIFAQFIAEGFVRLVEWNIARLQARSPVDYRLPSHLFLRVIIGLEAMATRCRDFASGRGRAMGLST